MKAKSVIVLVRVVEKETVVIIPVDENVAGVGREIAIQLEVGAGIETETLLGTVIEAEARNEEERKTRSSQVEARSAPSPM